MKEERSASRARRVALEALIAIEEKGAYAAQALGERLERRGLSRRDRRLATELVYGVTRWRGRLDHSLRAFSHRPLERLSPCVRNALRLAAYQVFFLRSVPGPVACSETVLLVKEREPWAAGFVNGVCRSFLREGGEPPIPDPERAPAEHLAVAYSHPVWLAERWLERLGFDGAAALMATNNASPGITLRVNAARARVEEVEAELGAEGLRLARGTLSPSALRVDGAGAVEELPGFSEGLFQIQDESSQLVAWVVDPPADGFTADLCAGPGGKSTHLAELLAARGACAGRVWSFDVHPHRVELVLESARRLGVARWIHAAAADARSLREEAPATFDRVLVDAPCTGTGVLRRRPDLRWRRTPEDLEDLVALQREILSEAARRVRVGGALVYSTCSLEEEENLGNAEWFLERHPGFRPSPIGPYLPSPARDRLAPERFSLGGSALQLWPHLDGTDGFFIFRAVRAS